MYLSAHSGREVHSSGIQAGFNGVGGQRNCVMRIAVLADIHGNLPAFEATLEDVKRQGVDQIVIAGDIVVGAPDSRACWDLAQSLGCPIIRGNHERYVSHLGTPKGSPSWLTEQFAPVQFAHAQFTDEDRARMADLPRLLRLPHAPNLLLVHASARNDSDTIAAYTPEKEISPMFAGFSERTIVRGHNHLAQVRLWGIGRIIITSGAVGLPLDGNPSAQYLLLDQEGDYWDIQHQAVPYDLDATIARFRDTDYLAQAGPIGRLFLREVVTAGSHLVPFLRLYTSWSQTETISLDQAVERFLNYY